MLKHTLVRLGVTYPVGIESREKAWSQYDV